MPFTPANPASVPAGAFHTPRVASVRAYTPAMTPHGAKVRSCILFSGSGKRKRGKYAAAFSSRTFKPDDFQSVAVSTSLTFGGASIKTKARRGLQYATAALKIALGSTFESNWVGLLGSLRVPSGMQRMLNKSTLSSA